MIIEAGEALTLGTKSDSWLRFVEETKRPGAWRGNRLLYTGGRQAFELSFWCGTCQFLFQRLGGATEGGYIKAVQEKLARGIDGLQQDIIAEISPLLPKSVYLPLLLEISPRLVFPGGVDDYFAGEQVRTWGMVDFWGLPANPHVPYYRTFQTVVDSESHLYEFVVPMVPPSWNEGDRVQEFEEILATGGKPTAVAISILDVCAPAVDDGPDWYYHWALTHFLIDGHHKMEAAAKNHRQLRLLTLLSMSDGLSTTEQVSRIPDLRSQPASTHTA